MLARVVVEGALLEDEEALVVLTGVVEGAPDVVLGPVVDAGVVFGALDVVEAALDVVEGALPVVEGAFEVVDAAFVVDTALVVL